MHVHVHVHVAGLAPPVDHLYINLETTHQLVEQQTTVEHPPSHHVEVILLNEARSQGALACPFDCRVAWDE